MSDEFLLWATEYFTPDKLNVNIDKRQAFQDFLDSLPDNERKFWKQIKFKKNIIHYAEFCDYEFNPDELKLSPTEIERNEIRVYNDGKDIYCFHLRTKNL